MLRFLEARLIGMPLPRDDYKDGISSSSLYCGKSYLL